MRNLTLTLTIYLSSFIIGFAQDVSLSVDTLDQKVEKERYKYQSIDQYDQRFLIKLGAVGGEQALFNSNYYDLPFDFFAMEYKISNTISIEGSYYFMNKDQSAISLKLRRYFKNSQLANNLSGRYLAMEYLNVTSGSQTFDPYLGSDKAVSIQFGNQIKKSQFGFADFRLFSSYHFDTFNNSINVGLSVILGAAWGPTGQKSKLDFSMPFTNHRDHVLLTVENPTLVIGDSFDAIGLSFSVEKEIFLKGLTSRTQISSGFSQQNTQFISLKSSSISISSEVRKYLGFLKKPSSNEPRYSFSGVYAGVGINNLFIHRNVNGVIDGESLNSISRGSDRATTFLSLGYQERIGKRHFFDFFLRYSFSTKNNFSENTKGPAVITFGTRVGLNWGK